MNKIQIRKISNRITNQIILCIIISFVFAGVIVFVGVKNDDSILGIGGTILTALGFVITIYQVKNIKTISKETQQEVDKSVLLVQKRLRELFSITNCALANEAINEVENYLQQDKFEIAALKLKEVHKILISISINDAFASIVDEKKVTFIIKNIGLDINNLIENISSPEVVKKT